MFGEVEAKIWRIMNQKLNEEYLLSSFLKVTNIYIHNFKDYKLVSDLGQPLKPKDSGPLKNGS